MSKCFLWSGICLVGTLSQVYLPSDRYLQTLMAFSHQSKTTTRQRQDDDKTNVEPVHSYDAFHTRFVGPGVKGIIGMHRFNICLVVVLSLSCSGVKTPLGLVETIHSDPIFI